MLSSYSQFPSQQPPRLLRRLCAHFAHKVEVHCSEKEGRLLFSIGECVLQADDDALYLTCTAPSAHEMAELQEVVRRHLQGFAQVGDLVLQWQ
jgi:hypothetical protein